MLLSLQESIYASSTFLAQYMLVSIMSRSILISSREILFKGNTFPSNLLSYLDSTFIQDEKLKHKSTY